MIVGRLIPAGTGLTYHSLRRKNVTGLTDSEMAALTAAPAPMPAPTVAEPAVIAEVAVEAGANSVSDMIEGESEA